MPRWPDTHAARAHLPALIQRIELAAFLPFVMAACPGLPEDIAIAYLRQSAIDFCQRSSVLRRRVLLDLQAGLSTYPVWPESCETVVRVNEVSVDGMCYRGHRASVCGCVCGASFTIEDGLLQLSSAPEVDQPEVLEVRFTAAPQRHACEVDAVLYADWQEAIEDGALARLYLLPQYRFSSQPLAQLRGRSFAEHVRRARVQSLKSDVGGAVYAQAPRFV